MLRRSGIALAAFFLLTSIAWAQDNTYDISLGGAAGVEQAVDRQRHGADADRLRRGPGHGTIPVFRTQFGRDQLFAHGRTRRFTLPHPLTYRIQGTIAEYSGAYVFSFHQSEKIEPFVFAGAGALVFYPGYGSSTINGVKTTLPSSRQTRPAFLYGGGFDWQIFSSVPLVRRASLVNHLALRLQYRGLVYKAPDFNVQNLFTGAKGHMAEPSIGIVVKF